ncbi:radical SAM domain protein [Hungatella hathewayi CAG:224]|nr:radical SAM domain protein [Hungatella hathewayi CAG:224]
MIHQYINNGFHIIMDVNSGSVHSVDPVMYDAVEIVAERVPELAEPQPLPAWRSPSRFRRKSQRK